MHTAPEYAAPITGVRPVALDGDRLTLRIVEDCVDAAALTADGPALALLQRLLTARLGRTITIAPPRAGSARGGTPADRRQAYTAAERHPVVQDILRRFDADIVAREPHAHADFRARWSADRDPSQGGPPPTAQGL